MFHHWMLECSISHFFGPNLQNNPYLPHTHTYRGWPTACCLLCTAYLGISLMQGDAMKEQSDANPRCVCVRPDHASLHARVLFFYCCLSMCCYLCHTGFLVSGNVCIGVSCDVQIHDSEVCSCLRTHCLTLCLRIACVWEVMHAARRFRCQSGSSPHLFISMTEELSCQSS